MIIVIYKNVRRFFDNIPRSIPKSTLDPSIHTRRSTRNLLIVSGSTLFSMYCDLKLYKLPIFSGVLDSNTNIYFALLCIIPFFILAHLTNIYNDQQIQSAEGVSEEAENIASKKNKGKPTTPSKAMLSKKVTEQSPWLQVWYVAIPFAISAIAFAYVASVVFKPTLDTNKVVLSSCNLFIIRYGHVNCF